MNTTKDSNELVKLAASAAAEKEAAGIAQEQQAGVRVRLHEPAPAIQAHARPRPHSTACRLQGGACVVQCRAFNTTRHIRILHGAALHHAQHAHEGQPRNGDLLADLVGQHQPLERHPRLHELLQHTWGESGSLCGSENSKAETATSSAEQRQQPGSAAAARRALCIR